MICTQNTTYFSITSIIIGASLPLLIPLLHFGIISRLWDQYNFPVDKYNCRNTCWDTIFKGNYSICKKSASYALYLMGSNLNSLNELIFLGPIEAGSEYGSTYKHLYFNCNWTTCKLWVITVVAVISIYEATKYVVFVIIAGS